MMVVSRYSDELILDELRVEIFIVDKIYGEQVEGFRLQLGSLPR